jgi:hypothetical protein
MGVERSVLLTEKQGRGEESLSISESVLSISRLHTC